MKINNFEKRCKLVGLSINKIKVIENEIKKSGGCLYIVGGKVRDLISGKNQSSSPDLVTDLDTHSSIKVLNKLKIPFLKVGEKFGSLLVKDGKDSFDLTSMRKDILPDGRWTKIEFTSDIILDSKRRDFSINSIYCDLSGNLIDPNNGIKDLKNKKVKFIGKLEDRIKEDHLRILRFIRFSLTYSNLIDAKDLKKCQKYSVNLTKLSFERRFEELEKIILLDNNSFEKQINKLKDILESTLECRIKTNYFKNFIKTEIFYEKPSFHRRIKFLIRACSPKKMKFLNKIDSNFKKRLFMINGLKIKDFNKFLYKYPKILLIDQIIINYADKKITKDNFLILLKKIKNFRKKKFPLSGNDLKKLGLKPGKSLGNIFDKVQDWWISESFKPGKKQCIEYASLLLPRNIRR